MIAHYYEVSEGDYIRSFDTLEEAIEHCDKYGYTLISEIGGNWLDYEKCWFCEDWYESSELNKDGVCRRCDIAIKDHNGGFSDA